MSLYQAVFGHVLRATLYERVLRQIRLLSRQPHIAMSLAVARIFCGGVQDHSEHLHADSCCYCLSHHTGHHLGAAIMRSCWLSRFRAFMIFRFLPERRDVPVLIVLAMAEPSSESSRRLGHVCRAMFSCKHAYKHRTLSRAMLPGELIR